MLDARRQAARDDVRVGEHLREIVDRPARYAFFGSAVVHSAVVRATVNRRSSGISSARLATRRALVAKRGSSASDGSPAAAQKLRN